MSDPFLDGYLEEAEARLGEFQRRYIGEVPFSARPLFDAIMGELGVALLQLRITRDEVERAAVVGRRDGLTRADREAYFEAMVENAPDIVTVLEGDGSVRFESRAVEPELGWGPDELVGRNVFELVHEEDLPSVMKEVERALAEPSTTVLARFRFRHRDGSWRRLESIARYVADPGWFVVHSRVAA
jgi:PAS domain S-box-containing protein